MEKETDSQTCGLFGWVGTGRRKMEMPESRGLVGVRQMEGLGCRHSHPNQPPKDVPTLEITHHGNTVPMAAKSSENCHGCRVAEEC